MSAYLGIYERYAEDAAFLWHLRSLAVDQPHYMFGDLLQLDRRIDAHLNGLMTAPDESWRICRDAMKAHGSSEIFVAAVLAFRSLEVAKIQEAVEGGFAADKGVHGLISALGWLPGRLCHSWIKKFLTSKDFDHKYLGLAACSVRREDPGHYLEAILQRPDCIEHTELYARGLRLIGELKRCDLMPLLRLAIRDPRPEVSFWACWAAVMLGDTSVIRALQPVVVSPGPLQMRAIELCFRCLSVEDARSWIGMLASNPENGRAVISATASLGDPQAIPWLITQMQVPAVSRLAGEAFGTITGIALEANGLALEKLPDLDDHFPNEDPADERVSLDEDEQLVFPDPYKVAAIWQRYQSALTPGRRYFLGKPICPEHLRTAFSEGNQRHRRMAAMELALVDKDQVLANYRMGRHEQANPPC